MSVFCVLHYRLGSVFGRAVLLIALLTTLVLAGLSTALALEPVSVSRDDVALDITDSVDFYNENTDRLNISTIPGADGIVRRVEVKAKESADGSNWAVFALANNTNEQLDRLVVAPHYRLIGAGLLWPQLDSVRIVAITPSEGFSLERQKDAEADVFLITLDPGAVITLIAEQKSNTVPKIYLWDPASYKDTVNSYTLYHGIVLGISGLLALFLTILFVIKGSAIFPATAALAWGVLAYVCVDFGFWGKVVGIDTGSEAFWRAGVEVFVAVSLLIFLYAYLNLNRWHIHFSTLVVGWVLALVILLGVAFAQPSFAAGIARLSFAATVFCGAILICIMAIKRFDRAIMLIPSWVLITLWAIAAAMAVNGDMTSDIVQPALLGGLVLIVMLLGFTVMQQAFIGGALVQGLVSDVERQALALTGSGDIVWDWEIARDYFHTGDDAATILGIAPKMLNGDIKAWQKLLHPNDRDRFHISLEAILEHKRGQIAQTFRLRSNDGHYYWFELRARPMLGADGEVVRCIGTLSDVTSQKIAEERILFDAIHDNLTGLENRELFVNRLETVINLCHNNQLSRPSLLYINIDNFLSLNNKFGFAVGDTILLTTARRLSRVIRPGDALARLDGDQFAIMLTSEHEPDRIAAVAESLRRTLRAPVVFGQDEISLTASIGIASWTKDHNEAGQMMRDAELAMLHAKRFGGDRIEPYRPAFSQTRDETNILLEDLKTALERKEIEVVYQPVVNLQSRLVVGYEALVRWNHPRLGLVAPVEFISLAERSGLINQITLHVMQTSANEFAQINKERANDPLFLSVNLSSRELLHHDLINDISDVLRKSGLAPSLLRLEITESLVMDNPEHSSQVLQRLKALKIGLSLDDFGTGYSSLSYLTRYPFDVIKIDRSFLHSTRYKERTIVLRAIIAMAQGLNQQVITEGVENESDVTELLQLNCEMAQGYIFGEPQSIQAVIASLSTPVN